MALRFVDSCGDAYSTAQIPRKWTNNVNGAVSAAGGRRGSNGLSFGLNAVYFLATDAQQTWIIGFSLKMATNGSFFTTNVPLISFMDGTGVQLQVVVADTAGHLAVRRGATTLATSTNALPANSGLEYYIEFRGKIDPTVGEYELRVNGVAWVGPTTGANTRNTSVSSANGIQFGSWSVNGSHVLDDIYLCDATGSVNNTFLGDMRVDAVLPAGAGANTGLTPSTGSNFQNVDDTTSNDDTDYNSSTSVGTKDTYDFTNISHTPVTIAGVQVCMTARKDDAGARSICSVTRSGGTDNDGSTLALGTLHNMYLQIVELDPNTSALWTKTNLNAAEFGAKVKA